MWKLYSSLPFPGPFRPRFALVTTALFSSDERLSTCRVFRSLPPLTDRLVNAFSHLYVRSLPFFTQKSFVPHYTPLPRYYGIIRLLSSLALLAAIPSSRAELSRHAVPFAPLRSPPSPAQRQHRANHRRRMVGIREPKRHTRRLTSVL